MPGKNTNVASLPGKNTNVASLPEKNNYSLALSLPERPYLKKLAPVLIQDRDECSMIVNFKAVPLYFIFELYIVTFDFTGIRMGASPFDFNWPTSN